MDQDDDVDHYQLEVDPDGASGFSAVAGATDIDITDCTLRIPVYIINWVNALFRVVAVDAQGNELAASDEIDLFNQAIAEEAIGNFKAGNTEADDSRSYFSQALIF